MFYPKHFMHDSGMFARPSAYDMKGFEGSGADFMPEYKPYIFDGKTIIASPHKIFGPESNDVTLQLRKQKVDQILLADMAIGQQAGSKIGLTHPSRFLKRWQQIQEC